MKKTKLFLILCIFTLIATAVIGADLNCYISNSACDEATLLYMNNDTGGFNNAHAQLPSIASYSYRLCCNSTQNAIANSCGTTFLELSNQSNAHVQDPTQTITPDYSYNACISGNGTVKCDVATSCPSGYTCLLSMASDGASNYTNAHVGNCSHYPLQVCCYSNTPPTQATPILNSTYGTNYTWENLTCYNQSTSDADGDNVTNIYDFRINGTSLYSVIMPFDTNSSTIAKDYSPNGNNGTLGTGSNKPTWTSSGKNGGAYHFDGNDFINFSKSIPELEGTNISVEAWIKADAWSCTLGYCTILNQYNSADNGYYLYISYSGGQAKPSFYGGGGSFIEAKSPDPISTGSWYHLVGTANSSNLAIYVDGVLKNNVSWTSTGVNENAHIGYDDNYNTYFNGTIDEIRIWNRSLSGDQIQSLYNSGVPYYNHIKSDETVKGENWTCYITPNDGIDDGTTQASNWLEIRNSLPNCTYANITPTIAYTNTTLTCNYDGCTDADNDTITIYYNWSKNDVWQNINSQTLGQGNTTKGENWTCRVTPYDGTDFGYGVNSSTRLINNTAPTTPNLTSPTNGNSTLFWRNVTFTWNASYDPDEVDGVDNVTYELNITPQSCGTPYTITNINNTNYTMTTDLEVNCLFYWQVRAYDGQEYSNWTELWNFTIEPTIIISFVSQNYTDFGQKSPSDIDNTTDNSPTPLETRNDGNVPINLSLYAMDGLWDSVGLNTTYFQYKAGNTTETGSFNWSHARTATTWTNVQGTNLTNATYIAGYLHYTDTKDQVETEIRIQVPNAESPGNKSSIVVITGET